MDNIDLMDKLENKKEQIEKNILAAKEIGHNKVTVIMLLDEETEKIKYDLLDWLINKSYKVSMKKEDFYILAIEW